MENRFSTLEYGVMSFMLLILLVWAIMSVGTGVPVGSTICGGFGLLAMAAALWSF